MLFFFVLILLSSLFSPLVVFISYLTDSFILTSTPSIAVSTIPKKKNTLTFVRNTEYITSYMFSGWCCICSYPPVFCSRLKLSMTSVLLYTFTVVRIELQTVWGETRDVDQTNMGSINRDVRSAWKLVQYLKNGLSDERLASVIVLCVCVVCVCR